MAAMLEGKEAMLNKMIIGKMDWLRVAFCGLFVVACVVLMGCRTPANGFPDSFYDPDVQREALEKVIADKAAIKDYYASGVTAEKQMEIRSQYAASRLRLIDINYREFVGDFVVQKQAADGITEIAIIGMNSAGALIDLSSTTRILAGIAAGLGGSKAAADRVYYYEQTARALYASMNAERAEMRLRIQNNLRKGVHEYDLEQVMAELDEYYAAGTFMGALEAIERQASQKQAKLKPDIETLSAGVFSDDDARRAILAATVNTDGTFNQDGIDDLLAWLNEKGLGELDPGVVINNNNTAEIRKRYVLDRGMLQR